MFDPSCCFNERDVEGKLVIQYLLPELGFTPETWYRERKFGNIRLDFLAFKNRIVSCTDISHEKPCLIIETKHPKQDLERHVSQLKEYLNKLGVEFGLLTNGREIRIYKQSRNILDLLFRCFGREVHKNIGLIREIIGSENLNLPGNMPIITQNNRVDFAEVNQTKHSRNEFKKWGQKMKVIAIYHNKGGVGKTTVSVNLAAALQNKGKRVLLVDIDAQANSTFATGLIKFQFNEDDNLKDNNVYHLIESGEFNFISDLKQSSQLFNSPEIDVIPSHINLIDKQDKLTRFAASRFRLHHKIQQAEDDYDIVIIDAPPSRDVYAEIALIAADYLIIPSDLKPFANQGLSNVQDFISEIDETRTSIGKEKLNVIGVLPSKILSNTRYLEFVFPKQKQNIIDHYSFPIMESIIYERTALSHCVNKTIMAGVHNLPDPKSIFAFGGDSESVKEFRNLAAEVLNKISE
ncbi:AAA family ATPase [Acaryochloris sp. CCMEE 5410]|uniref:AAA family ATPase n=1 Tax=Acaryochloris sp. CCMEE 5410 TaxID=310037 RepID=UPI0002F4E3C7|nr:AAA family ATPase [Acaryochloris sp. CCMEE 5410]